MDVNNNNHLTLAFGIMITISFFGLVLILSFHSVPAENKDILVGATGIVFAAFSALTQKILGISPKSASGLEAGQGAPSSPSSPLQPGVKS